MSKKIVFLLLFFGFITVGSAQIVEPVKWKSHIENNGDAGLTLVFEAKIDKGWHVYSQFTPDGGSLPMELKFPNAKGNFQVVGKAQESKYKVEYSDVFQVNEYIFEDSFTLKQKIRLINPSLKQIKANIDFQVCQTSCINGNKDFTFDVPKIAATPKPVAETVVEKTNDTVAVSVDTVKTKKTETTISAVKPEPKKENKGLLAIFFLSFLGGFAALLTPCVFPMIPMTVSFFTKQSKTRAAGIRNSIFYGLSIIIIYVLLGSIITAIFGAEALNELSTNVWFNLIFFVLLVIFALSFLGAFEILLPNSWANKVDRQADRGGIVGILFMALALAIVSFSCTGIIVGDLLVIAASKGGIAPIVGMLGFSLALALPFMLFAMFPGWLNSLPKSGGWLNTVKVSLGFLELALAFKFLSNADLVMQMHLLEREVFLSVWIAVFGAWAFYLLGKITLPHDSPMQSISVGRLGLGLIILSFTVYMIPGLFGAPLKLISAFPPPQTYSESPMGFGGGSDADSEKELPDGAKFGEHGIVTFNDYEKGLAYAKKEHKPVMLDFTGFACVNCRKMEINVWSDEQVLKILKNDVVLISLYVDDKRELPQSEQYISKETGRQVVTIGNQWSDFIITRYKTNTQPYYVLVGTDEQNLNDAIGYTPNIPDYLAWLHDGISKFKK